MSTASKRTKKKSRRVRLRADAKRARKRVRGARKRIRRAQKTARGKVKRAPRRIRHALAAARYRRTYAGSIGHLFSREELPILLNRRGLTGRGAEIGVKKAGYSELVLRRWNGDVLISIDPWAEDDPEAYRDRANVAQQDQEKFLALTRERLAKFGDRSEVWRMTSVDAAARIPVHSLDFVFIDARHDRESVTEDLDAWFDKVRPGGIVAGHDYVDVDNERGVFGVQTAVDEFFAARGLPVHETGWPDPVYPSWFVEVPDGSSDLA